MQIVTLPCVVLSSTTTKFSGQLAERYCRSRSLRTAALWVLARFRSRG